MEAMGWCWRGERGQWRGDKEAMGRRQEDDLGAMGRGGDGETPG